MKTTKQIEREAKRLFRSCLVNGLLDEGRTRQVVQRIIDGKRRGSLALLSEFQRLVKSNQATVDAFVGHLLAALQKGV